MIKLCSEQWRLGEVLKGIQPGLITGHPLIGTILVALRATNIYGPLASHKTGNATDVDQRIT